MDGIAALELIDARASALTAEHLGVAAPVEGAWQLLIEVASDTDQTEQLADALEHARLTGEPAVGVDVNAQQRLWQVRESRRRGSRHVRSAAEIRCVAAVVGDCNVRTRIRRADRGTHPGRYSRAVRPHRRGQPAPQRAAVCARRRAGGRTVFGDDGVDRPQRRQCQLGARRRHPQAATTSGCRAPTPTSPRCGPSRPHSIRRVTSTRPCCSASRPAWSAAHNWARRRTRRGNACRWSGTSNPPAPHRSTRGATDVRSRPHPGFRDERGCRSPTGSQG